MTEPATPTTPAKPSPAAEVQRTRLNKPWLVRVIGLLIGVTALGGWFALDAWVIYPNRGEKAIKFAELAYLQEAQIANLTPARVDVADPRAELERLDQRREASDAALSNVEARQFDWLTQISRLHNLDAVAARNEAARRVWGGEAGAEPERPLTVFRDPRGRLSELNTELSGETAPKPLSTFDMPSQYGGLIVSIVAAVLMLLFFFRIRGQVYTYEPGAMRLTLPDGFSFTPDMIETVDKRKWDKFIVFLTLQGESGERRIDLFRHAPLEEWILEMERHHPNYDPDADDEDDEEDAEEAAEAGGEDEADPDEGKSLRAE